jgi:hypothetical protein
MKHPLHLNALWFFSAYLGFGTLVLSPGRLQGQIVPKASQSASSTPYPPVSLNGDRNVDQLIQQAIAQLELSGGVLANEGTPSARLTRSFEIFPGPAPLLSFRTFDREDRYRLGKLDLVVDDAGH